MKFLIFDNQIAGVAPDDQSLSNLPSGFTIAEYAGNSPIESLYFSNGEIQPIPPIPTDGDYQWNGSEWVEVAPIVTLPVTPIGPDWAGLLSDLRGSEIWAKSFAAASSSVPANSAWTLLYGALISTNHLPDLMFAIDALRLAMVDTEGGDFTTTQIQAINAIMADRGFPEIE